MLQLGSKRCRLLGSQSRTQNSQFSRFASAAQQESFPRDSPESNTHAEQEAAPEQPEQWCMPSVLSPPETAGLGVGNGCLLLIFQSIMQEFFF